MTMDSNVVNFPFNVADRGGMASLYRRHRVKREARVREDRHEGEVQQLRDDQRGDRDLHRRAGPPGDLSQ